MEPPSPSVYSTSSPRSALHNRVSMLLTRSPQVGANADTTASPLRASQKLRLTIAPRPSFRALTMRSSSTRPPSSTRSIIDATAPPVLHTASPTITIRVPLTPQERLEALYASPLDPINHTWRMPPREIHTPARQQGFGGRAQPKSKTQWSRLFSAKSFTRRRVRTKAIFATVFGITLLLTLGVYLGLAASGIGEGLMFHILFIIFILALTTVFCHSLLTMCMLILKPSLPRQTRHRRPRPTSLLPSEKPIPIVFLADEEASPDLPTPPPPTYGAWRDTKRMDPNLVHWAKLPPSPDTPTYEEAVRDLSRCVGHRPPSYVNGVLGREGADGDGDRDEGQRDRDIRHDSTVHPLERERVGVLFGEV